MYLGTASKERDSSFEPDNVANRLYHSPTSSDFRVYDFNRFVLLTDFAANTHSVLRF